MAHFSIPAHIVIGNDALQDAVPYLKQYGRKALIVTGRHVDKSPMNTALKNTLGSCGISYIVYNGITGEPTDTMINGGVKVYRDNNCDFVIGIGGGSPLDSAKAIAAMSVNAGNIADYNGKEITGSIPPVVAIPTTAGTGSEATKFTIITDTGNNIKMLLKGDCLIPKLAVVDPGFTLDMPKSITVATGLDALTHAVEAYTSKKAFCLTDVLAVSAVRRILTYLPVVYGNGYDAKAREEMAVAALEAGICINNSSVTIVHGMSRPIGALFHVPHGISNAMLLKECLGYVVSGAYGRFAALGRAVGVADADDGDTEAADKLLFAINDLCKVCQVPTLKEYGIDEEEYFESIEKMAEDAIASGSPSNSYREVTKDACISIYKKAFQ